jgi:hypothetical protein
MLTTRLQLLPRLQEVSEQIEAKSSYLRTDKEIELLKELEILDQFLAKKSLNLEFSELVNANEMVVSGPDGYCSCCGHKL